MFGTSGSVVLSLGRGWNGEGEGWGGGVEGEGVGGGGGAGGRGGGREATCMVCWVIAWVGGLRCGGGPRGFGRGRLGGGRWGWGGGAVGVGQVRGVRVLHGVGVWSGHTKYAVSVFRLISTPKSRQFASSHFAPRGPQKSQTEGVATGKSGPYSTQEKLWGCYCLGSLLACPLFCTLVEWMRFDLHHSSREKGVNCPPSWGPPPRFLFVEILGRRHDCTSPIPYSQNSPIPVTSLSSFRRSIFFDSSTKGKRVLPPYSPVSRVCFPALVDVPKY